MLGWRIKFKKNELEPSKRWLVQRLWLDTERLRFLLPNWKKETILGQIAEIMEMVERGQDIRQML